MNKFFGLLPLLVCTACAVGSGPDGSLWATETVVNPTCNYQVYRHDANGWLLNAPVTSFVFWGSYWQSSYDQTAYINIWSWLISNGNTFNRLAEYGVGQPILNQTAFLTNYNSTVPLASGNAGNTYIKPYTVIDGGGITLELNNEIQNGFIPLPTSNDTLYVVFLPPNTITNDMLDSAGNRTSEVGYHSNGVYNGIKYAYAIITYTSNPNDNGWIVNHEIMEAMTNPDGSGYWDDASRNEIGDLCDDVVTTIDGYFVQKVWSETLCVCL